MSMAKRIMTRVGHAPIFADAHRGVSMPMNRINSKKKPNLLTKIL